MAALVWILLPCLPAPALATLCGGGSVLFATPEVSGASVEATGLFGAITGLGGLCIGGVPVAIDGGTTVTVGGLPSRIEALQIGQVAWASVSEDSVATRIDVFVAAHGPLLEVDRPGRRLRFDDTWVRVLDDAVFQGPGPRPVRWDSLETGQNLAVSALPAGEGSLFATRIEIIPAGADERIVARGIPDLALLARRDGVGLLRVEGFLGGRAPDHFDLARMPWSLPGAAAPQLIPAMRLWVLGRVGGQVLEIRLPPARISPPAPPLFRLVPRSSAEPRRSRSADPDATSAP